MRITDTAKASIQKIVSEIVESGDVGNQRAEKLVHDIRESYALIEANPSVGIPASSAHENAKMTSLSNFDAYLMIYVEDADGIIVVGLILSWMTGA